MEERRGGGGGYILVHTDVLIGFFCPGRLEGDGRPALRRHEKETRGGLPPDELVDARHLRVPCSGVDGDAVRPAAAERVHL